MYTHNLETWDISEASFPAHGTPAQKLESCLRFAILAPSVFNTQPWHFAHAGDQIHLLADRSRALEFVDPDHRELIMSCGAALCYLRIALRRFGYTGEIETFPNPDNPDLLACIGLGKKKMPTAEDVRLFESLPKRHTNRMSFSQRPLAEEILETFHAAAKAEGISLQIFTDSDTRDALMKLIAEGDRDQLADPRFRREFARWIRLDDTEADGIPAEALGMPGLISHPDPQTAPTFDTGPMFAARNRQLASGSPVLLLFSTEADTPQEWLKTGQAMARILLEAAAEGITGSFLNAPIELPALRFLVREVAGIPGCPQLILRLGYGPEMRPTPRRSVQEVLIQEGVA